MRSTLHQETLKEYEAAANIDMDSRLNKRLFDQVFSQQRSHISWRVHLNIFCSVKMEFGELKAEAYSSLSILQNTLFSKICRIFFSLLETEQRLNSDFTIDF